MSTVYTDLNGAVSCYPRVDPCPSTGTIVMCRNTLSSASNASTNLRCPENLQISNGKVLYPSGNVFPSQSFDTCNQGYYISGFRLAECSPAGAWGNRVATCIGYSCPAPTLANGQITGTAPLYTASCNSGYLLSGSINVTCLTATTNTPLPTCIPYSCPAPTLANGLITGTAPVYTASCNTGYQLSGSTTVTCMDATTNTPVPTCVAYSCPAPTLANGLITGTAPVYTASCNTGYLLSGSTTVTCMDATTNTPVPTCVAYSCPAPTLANGLITGTAPC
ncbi:complement receptor type 1-like [Sycon ciliatum]|uniref:complement receptor type 1-like n=1 Tax=Sycon ciliatum TaxID=27933 RepID=UPI0031F5FEBA